MRRSLPLLLTILILGLTFAEVSDVRADTSKLAQGAQLDLTPQSDGTTDIQGKLCNCPAATSLGIVNGAQWAYAPTSYTSATLSQAQSASYGSGDFVPGEFEAYFIKTGNNKFYKLQFPPGGTNDGSGIDLEYDYLGTGLPPAPNANFSYTAYDLIVRFTDASTGGPASWSWTFGDGETGNGSFQQHVYYNPGTYNVCLTASNTGGDDTYCENVTVSQVPSTLVAPGGSIDFNSDGINDLQILSAPECSSTNKMRTLNSATYSFLGEDYRTATEADVLSKPFTSSGDFCTQPSDISDGVALKTGNDGILKYWTVANDDRGIRFEFEVYDSGLPPAPTASFTHETLDLIAKFTDTSTGSPSSWSWDFGDSSTSTNQNPQHVYADAGTYNVCLTATNAGGSSTPSCQNVTVTRLPSSVTLADGQSIDLNSDGVDDLFADVCNCGGNGEVMNLNVMNTAQWGTVNVINTDYYGVTLTDLQNSTITGTSPFIPSSADVYDTYGIRTGTNALVKLWSPENTNAGIRIEFEVLTAGETPPSTPVASFTADTPDASGLGLNVNFTDTSTNTPTAWAWDFGDGGTSSVRNPSHTFSSGDQYNVCLTATNSGGSDTNCQNLTVTESPNANFSFSVNGLVVTFTDTSTNAPTSWSWDFAHDGATSTAQNPSHTFPGGGAYNVCLTATNAGGSDLECRSVNVVGPPIASFEFSVVGMTVTFSDTSSGSPTSWAWDFGDGDNATTQNPTHTYTTGGDFTVCLTATSASGSSAPACQTVSLLKPVQNQPSGSITENYGNPTYTWTAAAGATSYQIVVVDAATSTTKANTTVSAASACVVNDCSVDLTLIDESYRLAKGNYEWWLRASNASTSGSWTGPKAFTLNASVPAPVTLTAVTNTSSQQPTFNWTLTGSAATASWFQVYVNPTSQPASPVIKQWVSRSSVCGSATGTTCSYVAPAQLSLNTPYQLWVQSYGPGGTNTTWAGPEAFTISVGAPAVPTNVVADGSKGYPVVTWDDMALATYYHIRINKDGSTLLDKWLADADGLCNAGTCRFQHVADFTAGTYLVAVQAWGPGGYNGGSSGNWSTVASFTLSSTPPAVPTGLNATNTSTPTPTFTWSGVDNGVWHHILVTKTSDNSVVLNKWFSGYDLNCTSSGQTCTLVSPSAIANGSYSWRVQVWGPAGFNGGSNTVWSTAQAMTVNVPTPAAINRIAPTDGATVSAGNVTLQWQADGNATWYRSIVKLSGTTVHDNWYDASLICSGGVCSINVNGLASGSYAWWIAGWSQGGIGVWTGTSFTANP